jgi:REP element-mobilizing transposase RayT
LPLAPGLLSPVAAKNARPVDRNALKADHRLVKLIKGRSSRFLRQEFPVLKRNSPTLWTNSSLMGTTGGAPLSLIRQYIEQQKHG